MFLAFALGDIIRIPFGWLLGQLYNLFENYGVAMIVFGILVQLILMPIKAKSKQSMMKMSRVQPLVQDIQRRYANDTQKQNEMLQKLYQEEGVSMGGGCLWSMVPLFILIPLFTVIREPLTYILGEGAEVSAQIIDVIKTAAPEIFSKNNFYDQVSAAQAIPQFAEQLKAAIPGISETTLAGVNFNFLGINLGAIPQFNVFAPTWAWDWAHIGAFLIPCMSAGSQVLNMLIAQKTNDSVLTNENGIQDKEMAKNSQQNQSTKMMMYMMPLMSLWIGFTVSASLSLYWFVGDIIGMISDVVMTKHYRKIYDAEDAIRLKKHLEAERLEEEKERIRAERRAANLDGITTNTSKKKLTRQQREQEAYEKAAAAKEYAAKKGIVVDEEENSCMSGIPSRPYCKGRNYDPNRYATDSTEE
jgi:YidC/Oxa1 family membrane protein insertase